MSPAITSGTSVTVTRGAAMTPFAITTTGYPLPVVSALGLPRGLSVKKVGTQYEISGTPSKTDALGTYVVTLTARNAKGSATQTLTVTLTS